MTDKSSQSPKQKSAVGLKYQQSNQDDVQPLGASSSGAPTVIAKGFGDLAEEIIALARQGKGSDINGYRGEFIQLVKLADSLGNSLDE